VVERVRQLRDQYPRWGKEKLAVSLRREGIRISGSTVGRVMRRLRARGLLVEPESVPQAKLARKRRRKPRSAIRKPRNYRVQAAGDLVQVDTLQVRLLPDEVRFQFRSRPSRSMAAQSSRISLKRLAGRSRSFFFPPGQ